MTITAVQKAEMDRNILSNDIGLIERKIQAHKTTALKLGAVDSHLDTLAKINSSLFEVHSRIAYQQPADMTPHDADYSKLTERVCDAKSELMEIKESILSAKGPPPTATPTPHTPHIKLPDMQLPSFEGRYEDWPSFEDLFKATVGNSKSLSCAQKLQYLKACVRGEAANLIKSFTITDLNYIEAWALLSSRYNNQSEIIYSLCKKILYQPHLKCESVSGLQLLLNTTMESVRSLKVMGQPTSKWDTLLVVSVVEKLDPDTRSEWAKTRTTTTPASYQDVNDFLEKHIRGLLARGALTSKVTSNTNSNPNKQHQPAFSKQRTLHVSAAPATCSVCKGSHQLYQCSKLREMDAAQRNTAVRRTSACLNCLRDGHSARDCKSTHACRQCSAKHHTLLHTDQLKITNNSQSSSSASPQTTVRTNVAAVPVNPSQRVFKTAVVDIEDSSGIKRPCRVLFDDCSEAEYITESCASALGLPKFKANVTVEGVAGVSAGHCKQKVAAKLLSRVSSDSVTVENLYILPKITGYTPRLPCESVQWSHIQGLSLADPTYDKPGDIDILLGTGIVSYIMKEGIVRGHQNHPVAYNSIFGWVISGITNSLPHQTVRTHHSMCKLEELVQRFWEVESIPLKKPLNPIETQAENHFISTHSRKPDGRYVVRLPFNTKQDSIGETRDLALSRLQQLERRFKKYPDYHQQYIKFMRDYIDLGHMELAPQSTTKRVYIPHHFVTKEDSTTTKLRVVFDASMKSSSGVSLNETLLVGATIQDDLFTQLVRFRTHSIAMKADIAKMYRQFEVHEDDRDYQTILWREKASDPVQEFRLKTVTYGTACAPFLATRCLVQLSVDEEHNFPRAASVLKELMYIDDFLGGGKTREDCLQIYDELNQLCASACLDIRKWCSSDSEVLSAVPPEMKEEGFHDFDEDTTCKALGIRWKAQGDYFYFQVAKHSPKSIITKREVLSEIARTFDPIGWLTPSTVVAKILFQDLWQETQDWDAPVSEDILLRWNDYCHQLQAFIPKIKIPRNILAVNITSVQLHGFCDSSIKAMACCLYLRTADTTNNISTHLITSRSRIAPIKQLSIPRLELNSAVLLAETIESVIKCFSFEYTIHAWTDSMITLSWLTSSARRWKSYVATRVATIQEIIPSRCWKHVRSSDNPADLPSRGISPEELLNSTLWWNGPPWLSTDEFPHPATIHPDEDELSKEERKKIITLLVSSTTQPADSLFGYSSLNKVVTTAAWLIRFVQFCRNKKSCPVGPLIPVERQHALHSLIYFVQSSAFCDELNLLNQSKQVSVKSKLFQLNPFVNNNNLLCVGERLQNAPVNTSLKNPVILPHNHQLTTLIIRDAHLISLHGGFTLTHSLLRRKYWILRGRDTVRHITRKCVTCRKIKANQSQQQMGNLPSARVTQHRPFLHSGVDFAGSFPCRMRKGRGASGIDKVYMAVFVCFSTKAVHL